MGYNKIIIQGNLTRDIEVRYSQSGSAIGNTGIAVSRKYKSASGEQKEEVLFVDVTMFGKTAEIGLQYLKKGSKVLIDGRLKLDQWSAQDGSKRSKHTITVENLQMLDSKPSGEATPQNNMDDPNRHNVAGNMNKPAGVVQGAGGQEIPVELDVGQGEIPF